jgi:hypothetical protein
MCAKLSNVGIVQWTLEAPFDVLRRLHISQWVSKALSDVFCNLASTVIAINSRYLSTALFSTSAKLFRLELEELELRGNTHTNNHESHKRPHNPKKPRQPIRILTGDFGRSSQTYPSPNDTAQKSSPAQ